MSTTMTSNGQARKTLAEQIDRLDSILDGLADALNESVADAVKQAVGTAVEQAVRGVLMEVLTNPDALARARAALGAAPREGPAPAVMPASQRLRNACSQAGLRLGPVWTVCWARLGRARQSLTQLCQRGRVILQQGRMIAIAGAAGLAFGLAAYHAAPWLAALASGVGGFAATWTAQASDCCRWFLRKMAHFVKERPCLSKQAA